MEAASKAFEQEFERFVRFTGDPSALTALDLDTAIVEERALGELRTRHLGKKSALAAAKKLIGRVAPEERAAFGQLVQSMKKHRWSRQSRKPSRVLRRTSNSSALLAKVSTSRNRAGGLAQAIAIRSR